MQPTPPFKEFRFFCLFVFAIEGVSANCCMGLEPANIEIAA